MGKLLVGGVGLVCLLLLAASCDSSSTTASGPSVNVGGLDGGGGSSSGADANSPTTDGAPATSDCGGLFEPIEDAIARYEGRWIIDDAKTFPVCPNGLDLELVHIPTSIGGAPAGGDIAIINPPVDTDQQNGCPPSAFFVVKPTSLKECRKQLCWEPGGGEGFYLHANYKVPPNPSSAERYFHDRLQAHLPSGWSKTDGQVSVDPQKPNTLLYDDSFGIYTRPNPLPPPGTCGPTL